MPPRKTQSIKSSAKKATALKTSEEATRDLHLEIQLDDEENFRQYLRYLSSPKNILWRHFLAGTAQGLGFLLGSAIILWITSFILANLLGEIPLVANFSRAVEAWIQAQTNTP
jgi:hypothetical protein